MEHIYRFENVNSNHFSVNTYVKLLISTEQLQDHKALDKIPIECETCKETFYAEKRAIQRTIKGKGKIKLRYCSKSCAGIGMKDQREYACLHCNEKFFDLTTIKRKFCSRNCSVTYNNLHKTYGIRRSKLEKWLEKQLAIIYPTLEIHYCRKDAINSELDIYLPSLRMAFELNGIFHYEPIHGQDRLDKIKNNDGRKYQACIEKEISLCIIDTSTMSYFKEEKGQKYLNIITNIINNKIGIGSQRVADVCLGCNQMP